MILPNDMVLRFFGWIAGRLGLDLDFGEDGVVGSLDEHEVSEQLQYGRD
jgi:hypothetical protein